MDSEEEIVFLGIDPGLRTGYGIISAKGRTLKMIKHGCIAPSAGNPNSFRYKIIFDEVVLLIKQFMPSAVAVEMQFVDKNKMSGIEIGIARGVVSLAATLQETPVFGYPPARAKQAVSGSGKASKEAIQRMVQLQLGLKVLPFPNDAADALALAICHYHAWFKNQHHRFQI